MGIYYDDLDNSVSKDNQPRNIPGFWGLYTLVPPGGRNASSIYYDDIEPDDLRDKDRLKSIRIVSLAEIAYTSQSSCDKS